MPAIFSLQGINFCLHINAKSYFFGRGGAKGISILEQLYFTDQQESINTKRQQQYVRGPWLATHSLSWFYQPPPLSLLSPADVLAYVALLSSRSLAFSPLL
jgi:hypothetical protein